MRSPIKDQAPTKSSIEVWRSADLPGVDLSRGTSVIRSVPPHWHSSDENVTVIQGTLMVGKGEKFNAKPRLSLPAPDRLILEDAPVTPVKRQVYVRCLGGSGRR